jgi:hypothetical protein
VNSRFKVQYHTDFSIGIATGCATVPSTVAGTRARVSDVQSVQDAFFGAVKLRRYHGQSVDKKEQRLSGLPLST